MSKTKDQILAELARASWHNAGSHTDGYSWLLSLAANAREALGLPEPKIEHEWVQIVRPDRVASRMPREHSDYIDICRLCKINKDAVSGQFCEAAPMNEEADAE